MNVQAERNLYGKTSDVPGPGYYTLTRPYDHRIPIKIREQLPLPIVTSTRVIHQGPTTWASLASSTNACFKTKAERSIFPRVEETPDPAAYEQIPIVPPKPGDPSGFGSRADRFLPDHRYDTPGPGAYENILPKWTTKTTPTTRHAVDRPRTDVTPGPGQYEQFRPRDASRPSSVFAAQDKRALWYGRSKVPGPGAYNPLMPGDAPRPKKIHEKFKHDDWVNPQILADPSPDAYQSIDHVPQGPSRTIGRASSTKWSSHEDVPGPGYYEVTHQSFLRKSHNSSIPPMP